MESHLEFMKKQSEFAHDLARLGKFWNKTLYFEDYVPGRSTIIELIAVDAAWKTEQKFGKPNYVNGFEIFLDQMTKLDTVKLYFTDFWPKVTKEPLRFHSGPIILEPNNPYNNFGTGLKPGIVQKFKEYAMETIHRLSYYKDRRCNPIQLLVPQCNDEVPLLRCFRPYHSPT